MRNKDFHPRLRMSPRSPWLKTMLIVLLCVFSGVLYAIAGFAALECRYFWQGRPFFDDLNARASLALSLWAFMGSMLGASTLPIAVPLLWRCRLRPVALLAPGVATIVVVVLALAIAHPISIAFGPFAFASVCVRARK